MRKRIPLLFLLVLQLAGCHSQAPTEADRNVVIRAEHLAAYGVEFPENFRDYETLEREQWLDGSISVSYEFAPPAESGLPYIYSTAERHASQVDACASFHAANAGLGIGGLDLQERDDLFTYGARSRFGILVDGDKPLGNLFGMCTGKHAFLVMFSGLYFDEKETWEELVLPVLAAVKSMR